MSQTPNHNPTPTWLPYLTAAGVFHALAVFFMLLGKPTNYVPISPTDDLLTFRLIPPPEGETAVFMLSSNPEAAPPTGQDNFPDPGMQTGGNLEMPTDENSAPLDDAELAEFLASEREALRAELEQVTDLAQAAPIQAKPLPMPPPKGAAGSAGPGPEGAIRELDLDGFPQPIVDDIMKRYNLKVVTRTIKGGRRGQSFLSSASRGKSEQYFGGMAVPDGVYEVFQLSRESVALMSRLEEEALRKDGFEPVKSRVIRIVFGIVKQNDGSYVLGVKSLEAEAVGE